MNISEIAKTAGQKTNMVMVELPDQNMSCVWECSVCYKTFPMTKQFEKRKTCPVCHAAIDQFIELYYGDEQALS